jgi:hypothetical protein
MTKVTMDPTGYAPMELLVRQSVSQMGPEQFAVYDAALRATDYYGLPANDRVNFEYAIRAANERRAAESRPPLNVTIRDGIRPNLLDTMPTGWWIPLAAIGVVLLLGTLNANR